MEKNEILPMPNLYLIGFMGVGKSAVGRAVARQLNMDFVDSDWKIERDAGQSIASIFADKGEIYFRKLEKDFIESGHEKKGSVVSCGGGLPIAEGMGDLLLGNGIVVCLFATPETIISRTVGNPKRPLLNTPNPEESVRTLLLEREPIYMRIGIGVSTEGRGIKEIVKNVCRIYKREAKRWKSNHRMLNKLFNRYAFLNSLAWGLFIIVLWSMMAQQGDPDIRRGYGSFVVYGFIMLIISLFLMGILNGEAPLRFKKAYRWLGRWHIRVLGIIFVGGLLGAFLFLFIGSLAGMGYTPSSMLKNGLFDGAFYALIWAPGIALIWCIMLAKKESDLGKLEN